MLPACIAPMLLRRTPSDIIVILTGLAFDVAGCLLFANGPGLQSLLAGRFLMGVGTGLCFLGATRFLVKSSRPGREGVSFGLSWGMLSVGTALGPAVGAIAVAHGATLIHDVFAGTFAACMAALALSTLSAPVRRVAHAIQNAARAPIGLLSQASFLVGLAPSVVPAITFGVFYTLVPLRLSQDSREQWVSATFVAAAVLGAGAAPLAGYVLRVYGQHAVASWALVASGGLSLALATRIGPIGVVAVTIVLIGLTNQFLAVASGEMVRVAGHGTGGADATPMFISLVYAVFETTGAVAGAQAGTTNPALPYLLLGGVAATCAVVIVVDHRRSPNHDRGTDRGTTTPPTRHRRHGGG